MTEQGDIINRLLDKYENSRHLSDPGTSPRRVMLKVEKRDLPAYIYEDAVIRDAYNEAALELEKKHLVQLEWVKGRPVLSAIVLRLDQIPQCYASAERVHPKVRATQVIQLIDGSLKDVAIPWIIAWKVDVCRSAENPSLLQDGRYPIAGSALRFPRVCSSVRQYNDARIQQQVLFRHEIH